MYVDGKLWIASSQAERIAILPKMANRHGLIAGATGTGKTVTLKVLAESFSDMGVPVFLTDVKGDLAGMCRPGEDSQDMQERIDTFGLAPAGFTYQAYPTCFWDTSGKKGLPLRTTISEMGPLLLARLLGLTQVQSDILSIVFRIADEDELLLIDTKDLRAMLQHVAENSKEYSTRYGNLPKQSVNAILRAVIALETQGGEQFFGEPALDLHDWMGTDAGWKGMIHILDCGEQIQSPLIYSSFMLWMMSELFELLPERGDEEKPRMVFFFDEAHLLFTDMPKVLRDKIEQVVKLIRSKGVGLYFITQSPSDIPDGVLAQLGNRILHALHAYTPAEQKKLRAAAQSFRPNPAFCAETALAQLGIGQALVSFLDEEGRPGIVMKGDILPPKSQMGAITEDVRRQQIEGSPLYARYSDYLDRDSAYEFLMRAKKGEEEAAAEAKARKEEEAREKEAQREAERQEKEAQREAERQEKEAQREADRQEKEAARQAALQERERQKKEREAERAKKQAMAPVAKVARSAAGTIGREVGNEVGKKVGGSFGKRLGGNVGAQLARGLMDTLFSRR